MSMANSANFYLHSDTQLSALGPPPLIVSDKKTSSSSKLHVTCRFWKVGKCRFGPKCRFRHGNSEDHRGDRAGSTGSQDNLSGNVTSTSSSSSEDEVGGERRNLGLDRSNDPPSPTPSEQPFRETTDSDQSRNDRSRDSQVSP